MLKMLYFINKTIFSLCLFYLICESKCEHQGIISPKAVTEELSTHWETVATATEENWVTETTTEENWETVATTEGPSETTTVAPIHSECGGIIEIRSGEHAIIEYKLHENYNSNEQCIWTIRNHDYSATELRTLQLLKTESNFEVDFDFLQISSFEKNSYTGPTQSDKIGRVNGLEVLNFTGPVVFVVFSSDGSDEGMGFRIEISTEGDQQYNYEVLNYFSKEVNGSGALQPYANNLMATFVVSQEGDSTWYFYISYRLDYPSIDFIRVYTVERNGGIIRYSLLEILDSNGGRFYVVSGYSSILFILESNASNVGEGIEFEWFDTLWQK